MSNKQKTRRLFGVTPKSVKNSFNVNNIDNYLGALTRLLLYLLPLKSGQNDAALAVSALAGCLFCVSDCSEILFARNEQKDWNVKRDPLQGNAQIS